MIGLELKNKSAKNNKTISSENMSALKMDMSVKNLLSVKQMNGIKN